MPKKIAYFGKDTPPDSSARRASSAGSAGHVTQDAQKQIAKKKQLLRRLSEQQQSNYEQLNVALMVFDDSDEPGADSPAGFLLTPSHDVTTPTDASSKSILRERRDNSQPVTQMQRLQRDIANTSSAIDKLTAEIEQAEADLSGIQAKSSSNSGADSPRKQ